MFKRIMLSLTFLATFGMVGVGLADTSQARRYWGGPRVSYYHGPPVYYRSYRPFYGPRYYDSYYYGSPRYYGSPGYYYGAPRGGVHFSFGF